MAPEKQLHIFLAEDDEDDRDFFRIALRKVNRLALLTEAPNGAEALKYFRTATTAPHFIFLDINMPLFNGIECLREIRTVYAPEIVPVIMLSTSGSQEMINLSFKYGANMYLQKPDRIEHLSDHLRYCMGQLQTTDPISRVLINT